MPLHDASYQHWTGRHLGIWSRRGVIARQGLQACLENRWTRHLLVLCWGGAALLAAGLFALGQLLVADSLIVQWSANLDPVLQTFVRLLTQWLEQHPEISVRTTQNILFYFGCRWLLPLSLAAIALAIPHLVTRDLSSNAITIYAAKAVGRLDYALGKFMMIFGLLGLTWLGPLVAAWFLGNLLAPDWHFFWHSRLALFNTLAHVLPSMAILSLLALGVSAVSAKEKTTVALWVAWWIAGYALAGLAEETKPWLRHFSLKHDLDALALGRFRLQDDVELAQQNIPVLGDMLKDARAQLPALLRDPPVAGSRLALSLMCGTSLLILRQKLKPE
jgi:hypothetical protein